MKPRVLGFSENGAEIGKMPIAFFHTDARGRSCVNGHHCRILPVSPGSQDHYADRSFTICLSSHLFPLGKRGFLHFSTDGVILDCKSGEDGGISCEVLRQGFVTVSETVEFWPPIYTGIMTVSDKGSRGEREDTSGPALAKAVESIGGIFSERTIVPDVKEDILSALKVWTTGDNALDLVLITGGTGLAARDITPEALAILPGKDVPGLGEYMRWKTSSFTLRSILSRGTAKVIGRTLVLALPGSRRGAMQCFEAVSPVLRHAVEIASGKGGECGGHHS